MDESRPDKTAFALPSITAPGVIVVARILVIAAAAVAVGVTRSFFTAIAFPVVAVAADFFLTAAVAGVNWPLLTTAAAVVVRIASSATIVAVIAQGSVRTTTEGIEIVSPAANVGFDYWMSKR
jgi:hypothetical protein